MNRNETLKVSRLNLDAMKDQIYIIQCDYEEQDNYNEQSIRVRQRISGLLNIYRQIVCDNRVFEEDYLKQYLGEEKDSKSSCEDALKLACELLAKKDKETGYDANMWYGTLIDYVKKGEMKGMAKSIKKQSSDTIKPLRIRDVYPSKYYLKLDLSKFYPMAEKDLVKRGNGKEIYRLRGELLKLSWGFNQAIELVANTISCDKCPCRDGCDKCYSFECLHKIATWCLRNGKN